MFQVCYLKNCGNTLIPNFVLCCHGNTSYAETSLLTGPTLPLVMPPTFFILRRYLKNTKKYKILERDYSSGTRTDTFVLRWYPKWYIGTPTGTLVLCWYPKWYICSMSKVRLPVGVPVYYVNFLISYFLTFFTTRR